MILAVDPGRDKCGLAVLTPDGEIVDRRVVAALEVESHILTLTARHHISQILLGNSTASARWHKQLLVWLPDTPLEVVDEAGSTWEARALYWQANPPRGWRRLVPLSLQAPPEPIDDFAAVVLARRHLQGEIRNPKSEIRNKFK